MLCLLVWNSSKISFTNLINKIYFIVVKLYYLSLFLLLIRIKCYWTPRIAVGILIKSLENLISCSIILWVKMHTTNPNYLVIFFFIYLLSYKCKTKNKKLCLLVLLIRIYFIFNFNESVFNWHCYKLFKTIMKLFLFSALSIIYNKSIFFQTSFVLFIDFVKYLISLRFWNFSLLLVKYE